MSHSGGDNHFISARDRDLRPLLEEGIAALELGEENGRVLETFLAEAWLSGTRNGHAKLMNHAIRRQQEPDANPSEPTLDPAQLETIEAELKAMMEASAQALSLSEIQTVTLWDLLSRAFTTGVQTYEAEVMASLIERRSDVVEEARRWLDGEGG